MNTKKNKYFKEQMAVKFIVFLFACRFAHLDISNYLIIIIFRPAIEKNLEEQNLCGEKLKRTNLKSF